MAPSPGPIVRFAPSPTGMLHVGGARTALFNWLFARHHRGEFLLRIEDTDRQRSTEEAKSAILNGLKWLELDWDRDVIYQSQRLDRHREVAQALLAGGGAYRCYATAEELEAMREAARRERRPMRYDGRWRDRDSAEAPQGVQPTVRIKAPPSGTMTIQDIVQGEVRTDYQQLDDFILLRSDGSPTYMLSAVVDDHDMKITHIIRGDDHLTNAFRQRLIYDALDWPVPAFAHIPLIHGPDGTKLSKRHGALSVEAYRDMGYLPAAVRNYLLRLGWSHGNDEIISTDEAISWFNLESIGRGPARFDLDRLNFLNGHYIRQSDDRFLAGEVVRILRSTADSALSDVGEARIGAAMSVFKQRAKTLVELAESCQFLVAPRPLPLNDTARAQLDGDARVLLAELKRDLDSVLSWTAHRLEERVRAFADGRGLKFGQVAQKLRAAVTGGANSPGVFEVLAILGREESLNRIGDQTPEHVK